MNDADYARLIREGSQELQHAAMTALKRLWRDREREFIAQHGRTGYCDCLFYENGDYEKVYLAATQGAG